MSPPLVRRQLERILADGEFAQSERLCRFLRLAVEYSLEDRAAELKEYLIATEAFDRKSSFDPRLDPIVRVEARRLRTKLARYYECAGGGDEIVIGLPKGSYAAIFSLRTEAAALPSKSAEDGTIAILPFADLSAECGNEYFSDGLTQELILRLTRVDGLRVVAWNSAAQLRGATHDIPAIGRQLKVASVLMGSVRRVGDDVRIAVQLIATETNQYLWSEAYDRRLDDLLRIQDEIARAIVDTLRIRLAPAAVAATPKGPLPSVESHNLYLMGRFHWSKRTPEGLRKSVGHFERALALDEDCALCWAGLADALTLLCEYGQAHPSEAMTRARQCASRAVELDPLMGEAWTSLALIRCTYEWEWTEAEELFRRAIQLNPGYSVVHFWYAGDLLAPLGRLEEAKREIAIARQLDPLSPLIVECDGFLDLVARRYDEAIEAYREALDLDPNYYKAWASIGRALIQKGLYDEALEMLEKAHTLGGEIPNVLGALGQAYALAGWPDRAREILAQLNEAAKTRHVTSTSIAIVHLGLAGSETARGAAKERDLALRWLEAGCDRRELPLANLKISPVYDSLRDEPRFQALLRHMRLAG